MALLIDSKQVSFKKSASHPKSGQHREEDNRVTWEDYKGAVHHCREKICVAKTQ